MKSHSIGRFQIPDHVETKLKEVSKFGVRKTEMTRNIAVLNTGAGLNFFIAAQVPEDVATRKIGMDPKISDENGHLLKICGIISLFLRFGTYVIKMYFFVCERLADQ